MVAAVDIVHNTFLSGDLFSRLVVSVFRLVVGVIFSSYSYSVIVVYIPSDLEWYISSKCDTIFFIRSFSSYVICSWCYSPTTIGPSKSVNVRMSGRNHSSYSPLNRERFFSSLPFCSLYLAAVISYHWHLSFSLCAVVVYVIRSIVAKFIHRWQRSHSSLQILHSLCRCALAILDECRHLSAPKSILATPTQIEMKRNS